MRVKVIEVTTMGGYSYSGDPKVSGSPRSKYTIAIAYIEPYSPTQLRVLR